ncbi:MAG: LysE/ArgO family amino acid transporter [Hyphomicrobiales bacterium]
MLDAYLSGLALGFSLILAIGAQNAFVLRQGIRGEHVGAICTACTVSDAVLIFAGTYSLDLLVRDNAFIREIIAYAGAGFLFLYGAERFYSAFFTNHKLTPSDQNASGLSKNLAVCLALTWLNPHVYLDTFFLIGSAAGRFTRQKYIFAAGAATASFLFFFALGYGAARLRSLFSNMIAWKILDGCVGLTLWFVAVKLLMDF